jgi:hypothetical protein
VVAGVLVRLRSPRGWYHHDRAVGMLHDLAADGTHDEPGEPARATGPDDHHVGAARSLDQLLAGKPVMARTVTEAGWASPLSLAALRVRSSAA